MFPIYMWVKKYKGLKDFEITFDNNYKIIFDETEKKLLVNKKDISIDEDIKNFYSIEEEKRIRNIDSVNLLIGKNGSGKTSILEILDLNIFNEKILDKKIEKINYIILYKSNINNEDFILEKYDEKGYISNFIKIKETQNLRIEEELYKNYKDNENYLENIGVIKFSFKEKEIRASLREAMFQKEKQSKTVLYKLNIGLENGSKEKIYNYLIEKSKRGNIDNFENAYMRLVIIDLYSQLKNQLKNQLKEIKIEGVDSNLHVKEIDELFRLYSNLNKSDLKNLILNNYYNYIYVYIILGILKEKNKKIFLKEEIQEEKNKLQKSLNNKSPYEKFKILLKKIEELEDYKYITFNKKSYKNVENIATIIDSIQKDIINTENTEIIEQFKINCKEKNLEIIELLKEYDSFYIPKIEEEGDLLFKEVEFIKIEEDGLSDGEKIKLYYFSTLYSILNGEFKNRKYITLLFDEIEAFLHPEWSRIFLYELIKELEEKYPEKKFKLIFATHSPFLIADVLAKDCIYLEKENGKIEAKIDNSKKTFGANIIDLFKNSMFLESTFGKFATEKIKWVVNKIDNESYTDIKNNSEINYIIEEIGEKLISNKLKSMIEAKLENKDNAKDYYKNKIEEYQAKIREIEEKEGEK